MTFSFRYVVNTLYDSPRVSIFFDDSEGILYCYDGKKNEPDILKENAIQVVKKIEQTNFRRWYNLYNPFVTDGVEWSLEYCDKNKPEHRISGSNMYPKSFDQYFEIILELFPEVKFPVVYDYSGFTSFFSKKLGHHILPYKRKSEKELLLELCDYIQIFEEIDGDLSKNRRVINNFKKKLREITDTCKNLDLYNNMDLLNAYCIAEYGEETESKLDVRTALLMIISYAKSSFYDNRFEKEFKSGEIIKLLKYIKENQ